MNCTDVDNDYLVAASGSYYQTTGGGKVEELTPTASVKELR